jgi:hypothetical protein
MSKVKVILQGSYGVFEPSDEFAKLIESKGYKSLWSISARTDKDLIEYVEQHANEHGVLTGKEDYQYVHVAEVDTSKLWTIDNYDGAESILYLDYEVIDKNLNYVRLK